MLEGLRAAAVDATYRWLARWMFVDPDRGLRTAHFLQHQYPNLQAEAAG